MYSFLDRDGMRQIQIRRLASLEQEHFRIMMLLEEMDLIRVPDDAPERRALVQDLEIAGSCMSHHRAQLGLDVESGPRVVPDLAHASSDDEPIETKGGAARG